MAGNSLTKLVLASALVISTIGMPMAASAQSGIASVYSGGRTANGENARASGLTAAHRTLPFGTHGAGHQSAHRPLGGRAHQRSRAVRPRPRHRRDAGGRACAGLFRPRARDARGGRQDLRQVSQKNFQSHGLSQSRDKRDVRLGDELQQREASASRFFMRAATEPIGNHIVHTQATIVGQHARSPPRLRCSHGADRHSSGISKLASRFTGSTTTTRSLLAANMADDRAASRSGDR